MRTELVALVSVAALVAGGCTCGGASTGTTSSGASSSPSTSTKPSEAKPGAPWPREALVLERVHYGFGLEFSGEPKNGPEVEFHALRTRSYPSILVQPTPSETGPTPAAFFRTLNVGVGTYTPPKRERIAASQKGLSDADMDGLTRGKAAVSITFFATRSNLATTLRDASALVADLADNTGAIVLDETTKMRFSPAAFRADRVAPAAPPELPRAAANLLVNAYLRAGVPRALTRGMAKLGLPDLVIEDIANVDAAVALLDLTAQTLAERGKLDEGSALELDVKALRDPELRATLLGASSADALGRAKVRLVVAKREEGEPERLAEIVIDGPTSVPPAERAAALLAALFGGK